MVQGTLKNAEACDPELETHKRIGYSVCVTRTAEVLPMQIKPRFQAYLHALFANSLKWNTEMAS
jgi:hypothetical protein